MKKVALMALALVFVVAVNAFAFTAVSMYNSSYTSAYAGGMAGTTGWYHGYQTIAEVGGQGGTDNGALYVGFGWGQDNVMSQSDAYFNANSNQNAGGWHGNSSSHADTQGSAFSIINIQRW